ncbi:MAG: DUF3459 domain-containing protein [Actinobacteria bacterium]|nr:DUF3459 domain-containing protein [Actinomycetota bacterium]
MTPPVGQWWRDAVLYQIYPRSYADANGDGVGDLPGITAHLDHLAWLGVDAIWISPITVSPNADWGYDVADYCDVDPALGTLADVDALIAAADARGIRVVLDLVPNHTSIEHPWFVEARSSRDAPHRDWYVWADPAPDGGPPNNWVSTFTGPAWHLDDATGQYYMRSFLPEQADLNWGNPEVRAEFERILRFWFDRGVAGFRIDVAHMLVKDAQLRDNPPTDDTDFWMDQFRGQRQEYNANRPEVHDVYRRWREIAEEYDPTRLLLGETHVFDVDAIARFYGHDDELGLAFNFFFLYADFDVATLRRVVGEADAAIPSDRGWPVWAGSNHDKTRFPTGWAKGDERLARVALMMLLTLRGTPVLYYGDELGMPDTHVPDDRLLDPVTIAVGRVVDRDAARTPVPWTGDVATGAGFTAPGVEPWLPFGDVAACNVADQREDPGSMLHFTRDLLALRRATVELRRGGYTDVSIRGSEVWSFLRDSTVQVVLNLGDAPDRVPVCLQNARVLLATDRVSEGAPVSGLLEIEGRRGVVIAGDVEVFDQAGD